MWIISGLSILFHWSIFLSCASTILSWWLWLWSRAWSQAGWFLQFHSSFSRLLWLFKVFCISIQIVKLFVLVLWRIPIRKLWYIYTMEYYSAIKKNSFESVLMRWMKLEPIIQSEVSQKEKYQYSILMHIYGI